MAGQCGERGADWLLVATFRGPLQIGDEMRAHYNRRAREGWAHQAFTNCFGAQQAWRRWRARKQAGGRARAGACLNSTGCCWRLPFKGPLPWPTSLLQALMST